MRHTLAEIFVCSHCCAEVVAETSVACSGWRCLVCAQLRGGPQRNSAAVGGLGVTVQAIFTVAGERQWLFVVCCFASARGEVRRGVRFSALSAPVLALRQGMVLGRKLPMTRSGIGPMMDTNLWIRVATIRTAMGGRVKEATAGLSGQSLF